MFFVVSKLLSFVVQPLNWVIVCLLIGLRSINQVTLPRFRTLLAIDSIPREGLGTAWSVRALWPADIQAAALGRLGGLIAALVLVAAAVATLNAIILLAESSASRRSELAVRTAMGATPAKLVGMLLGDLRTLVFTGLSLGLILARAFRSVILAL